MKKGLFIFLFIAAIFIGYSLAYFNQYHIEDDQTTIQSSLTKWLYSSFDIDADLKPAINEMVQLNDTSSYIGLIYTPDGNVGYAHFIKGWNGKFKINGSGGNSNGVYYQKIKTSQPLNLLHYYISI